LLNRFYAQTKDINKKTIVKEVSAFGSADIISQVMKNSKIIILIRDGRDMVDSLLDARSKNGFMTKVGMDPIGKEEAKKKQGFAPIPSRNIFITNQSKGWVIRNENFFKAYQEHPTHLRYMVKYENLLSNTFEELKKLYKFIGIEISDQKLEKIIDKYNFKNIPEEKKKELENSQEVQRRENGERIFQNRNKKR